MSADRRVSNPRVHVEHPRRPEPSTAWLWVTVDWLKGDAAARCEMTEADLYALAEEALKVAGVLRRNAAQPLTAPQRGATTTVKSNND